MIAMTISEAKDTFIRDQKIKGNTPATIQYYEDTLGIFLTWYDHTGNSVTCLNDDVFKDYKLSLVNRDDICLTSKNTYLRGVKAFLKYLSAYGLTQIKEAELSLFKSRDKVIDILSEAEIKRLLAYYDSDDFISVRNNLIILLMLDSGLRRGEVLNIQINKIDFPSSCITLTGKGQKERIVPFGEATGKQLLMYIDYLKSYGITSGTLILSNDYSPLTSNGLKILFSRLKAKVGIKRLKPHLLRHTFATYYLINGGDVITLRNILGHTDIHMTDHYVNLRNQYLLRISKHKSCVDIINTNDISVKNT